MSDEDPALQAQTTAPVLPDTCACIVLAGGRSTRMGRDKAALPVGGVSLLQRVIERVRPLVREVVIVAAGVQTLPPTSARVVRDPVPERGPLPALALGLGAITTPWAFALACDTPFVRRNVLRALAAEVAGARAAIPLWNGRLQPLVALYHAALAPALTALVDGGESRLHAIATLPMVRIVPPARLEPYDPEGLSFRSLNTQAEYEAALQRWDTQPADD
jgi:molybdopterin-guanine dinucleotide biosynthesis protein A